MDAAAALPVVDSLESLLQQALSVDLDSLDDFDLEEEDTVQLAPPPRSPSAVVRAYVEPTPQAFTHGAHGVAITRDAAEFDKPRPRAQVLGLHGVAKLPKVMCFESWWREGKRSMALALEFHTDTGLCVVRMKFPVAIQVKRKDGSPLEPWDLHVGAVLSILEHKVILKKASLETQEWLDCQARRLLATKRGLVRELSKFKVLVEARGRSDFMPSKLMDALMHGCGLGGRVNLRALQDSVQALSRMLEEYRAVFLKRDLEKFRLSTVKSVGSMSEVSKSWDLRAVRASANDLAQALEAAKRAQSPPEKAFNHLEWLESIPLAASAARRMYTANLSALMTNSLGLKTASTETLLEKIKHNQQPPGASRMALS